MARVRGGPGSALRGVGQWIGKIAEFFRLGQIGAAAPDQPVRRGQR